MVAGEWVPSAQQSARSAAREPQQQWPMTLRIGQRNPPWGQMLMALITIESASTAIAILPNTIGVTVTVGYKAVKR
jgi:hypothetical protein